MRVSLFLYRSAWRSSVCVCVCVCVCGLGVRAGCVYESVCSCIGLHGVAVCVCVCVLHVQSISK